MRSLGQMYSQAVPKFFLRAGTAQPINSRVCDALRIAGVFSGPRHGGAAFRALLLIAGYPRLMGNLFAACRANTETARAGAATTTTLSSGTLPSSLAGSGTLSPGACSISSRHSGYLLSGHWASETAPDLLPDL